MIIENFDITEYNEIRKRWHRYIYSYIEKICSMKMKNRKNKCYLDIRSKIKENHKLSYARYDLEHISKAIMLNAMLNPIQELSTSSKHITLHLIHSIPPSSPFSQ